MPLMSLQRLTSLPDHVHPPCWALMYCRPLCLRTGRALETRAPPSGPGQHLPYPPCGCGSTFTNQLPSQIEKSVCLMPSTTQAVVAQAKGRGSQSKGSQGNVEPVSK